MLGRLTAEVDRLRANAEVVDPDQRQKFLEGADSLEALILKLASEGKIPLEKIDRRLMIATLKSLRVGAYISQDKLTNFIIAMGSNTSGYKAILYDLQLRDKDSLHHLCISSYCWVELNRVGVSSLAKLAEIIDQNTLAEVKKDDGRKLTQPVIKKVEAAFQEFEKLRAASQT